MSATSITIQDLLNSICKKNYKKFNRNSLLPFVILPPLLLVSAYSRILTVIIMVTILMGVLYVHYRPRQKNRSTFFLAWTLSSGVYLFLAFEFLVLHLLEVTQLEQFVFVIFLASTCYFFYKMKNIAISELTMSKEVEYCPVLTSDSHYCQICQIEVNDQYFHSIWWNCCIFKPNYPYYVAGLVFALLTLIIGVNLSLTTICDNNVLFYTVLVPVDCWGVYLDYNWALIFVCCIYAVGCAFGVAASLLHQLVSAIKK